MNRPRNPRSPVLVAEFARIRAGSNANPRSLATSATKTDRGAIAVVALVCVAVASVVMVVAVRRALGEWKMVRLEAQQVQCRWLAESALDRAAAQLASDPKYAGEPWKISARSLSGNEDGGKEDKGGGGAAVKIEVSTPPNEPLRRVVRVQADWPEDAPARVRVSKQATVELPPAAKGK